MQRLADGIREKSILPYLFGERVPHKEIRVDQKGIERANALSIFAIPSADQLIGGGKQQSTAVKIIIMLSVPYLPVETRLIGYLIKLQDMRAGRLRTGA